MRGYAYALAQPSSVQALDTKYRPQYIIITQVIVVPRRHDRPGLTFNEAKPSQRRTPNDDRTLCNLFTQSVYIPSLDLAPAG